MSNEITYQEYWAQCKSIALEAREEDQPFEYIAQTIDGHEWVINNWAHMWVDRYSDNSEVMEENTSYAEMAGIMQTKGGLSGLLSYRAYYAMQRDVEDCFWLIERETA